MTVDSENSKFNMLCKSGMVEVLENCESLREMPLEFALSSHNLPFLVFNQFESRLSALGSSVSVEWGSVKGADFLKIFFFFSFIFNPEHTSKTTGCMPAEIMVAHAKCQSSCWCCQKSVLG